MENDQIKKGFNSGYLLAEHDPALLNKIKSGVQDKDDPYVLGMVAGAEQYNKDRSHNKDLDKETKFEAFRERMRNLSKDRDHDYDRDR